MAFVTEIEEISSLSSSTFNWKIKNFSNFRQVDSYSGIFSVGSLKWRACIYPKGRGKVYDHLSLFLHPVDLKQSVNTEYSFAVISQTDRNNTVRCEAKHNFLAKSDAGWGWPSFMPLKELHDPSKGYIVDDTCIISIEVTCWIKEDPTVKESNPDKVPKAKRTRVKDERQ